MILAKLAVSRGQLTPESGQMERFGLLGLLLRVGGERLLVRSSIHRVGPSWRVLGDRPTSLR